MREIKGRLLCATVSDKMDGVYLRLVTDNNKQEVAFLPINAQADDHNPTMNAGVDIEEELKGVCDALNEGKRTVAIQMSLYESQLTSLLYARQRIWLTPDSDGGGFLEGWYAKYRHQKRIFSKNTMFEIICYAYHPLTSGSCLSSVANVST